MPKADLSDVLVRAGGGTRRRPEPPPSPVEERTSQPSRAGTRPITVHFPREVRDQLKILAVEQGTTMHRLIADALNDLFAKHGKPEIAPLDGGRE